MFLHSEASFEANFLVAGFHKSAAKSLTRMSHKISFLVAGAILGAAGVLAFSQPLLWSSAAAKTSASDTARELSLFLTVFDRVRSDYVDKPDDDALVRGAIDGMLSSLDPHSSYLSPRDFSDMTVELGGKFGGLGMEVTMEKGAVKVISPIDGTPAAKAGILANDLIVAIDKDEVDRMTLDEAVDRMRGPVGASITLTIERQGIEKPFDVKLVRREIVVQSVSSRAEGEVGYIRITEFGEQTFGGVKAAIGKLSDAIGRDRIKGYIIDLRKNPAVFSTRRLRSPTRSLTGARSSLFAVGIPPTGSARKLIAAIWFAASRSLS